MRPASLVARGSGEGDGKIKAAGASSRRRPCLHIFFSGAGEPEGGAGAVANLFRRLWKSWRRPPGMSRKVTQAPGRGARP